MESSTAMLLLTGGSFLLSMYALHKSMEALGKLQKVENLDESLRALEEQEKRIERKKAELDEWAKNLDDLMFKRKQDIIGELSFAYRDHLESHRNALRDDYTRYRRELEVIVENLAANVRGRQREIQNEFSKTKAEIEELKQALKSAEKDISRIESRAEASLQKMERKMAQIATIREALDETNRRIKKLEQRLMEMENIIYTSWMPSTL